jgi:hypothetical protein
LVAYGCGFFAGIRGLIFSLASAVCFSRWHPRFVFLAGIRVGAFAVRALPLCGAAPTFLCRGKEK